jgi:hypothetical protein
VAASAGVVPAVLLPPAAGPVAAAAVVATLMALRALPVALVRPSRR